MLRHTLSSKRSCNWHSPVVPLGHWSLYAVFHGESQNCSIVWVCDSTFHSIEQCPLKSLRTKSAKRPSGPAPSRKHKWPGDVCFGYNASGDCSYKAACKFRHVCGTCGGKHPAKSCSKEWFQLLAYMQMLLGSSVIKYDHASLIPRPFLYGRAKRGEGRVWRITLPQRGSMEFH